MPAPDSVSRTDLYPPIEPFASGRLRLDATHEVAARYLIRARATAGDVAGALGVYKALWEVLEREYDVEPSRETQELIAALRMDQHFAPAASPAPAQAAPSPAPGPPCRKTTGTPRGLPDSSQYIWCVASSRSRPDANGSIGG